MASELRRNPANINPKQDQTRAQTSRLDQVLRWPTAGPSQCKVESNTLYHTNSSPRANNLRTYNKKSISSNLLAKALDATDIVSMNYYIAYFYFVGKGS